MQDDKLTQEQRIRLEALNQAVVRSVSLQVAMTELELIETAKAFASFIQKGNNTRAEKGSYRGSKTN